MPTPRLPANRRPLPEATLSGALGGVLVRFLDARGLPARACRARLAHWKPDGRIPAVEWALCLHLIQAEDPRPALGLEIARHMQPEHAGLLAYLALACDDMGELVTQLERFHRLMWQGFAVQVQRGTDDVTLTWTPLQAPPPHTLEIARLAFETGIAGIVQLFRALAGDAQSPRAVTLLGAPPRDLAPYTAFFGCPVAFSDHTSSLCFPASTLRLPISAKDNALRQLVERQAQAQLRAIAPADAFLDRFRAALVRALGAGTPTLAAVAAELGMSRASLQRQLQARGTGFQQALDGIRYEMARMYLENPALSLAEVALLLAFSEQSAFCRAFRRWSGQPPLRYRRALLRTSG